MTNLVKWGQEKKNENVLLKEENIKLTKDIEPPKLTEDIQTDIPKLTDEDFEILSKKEIVWHKIKIKSWFNLNIGDFYKFKGGENVIVVDITQKPWVKQFGIVSNQDKNIINGVANIYKRYLLHCRCKSILELNENSLYCKKCGHIIPSKDICFKSISTYRYIRNKDIVLGESLIKNEDKTFMLVDLDYARRKDKIRII